MKRKLCRVIAGCGLLMAGGMFPCPGFSETDVFLHDLGKFRQSCSAANNCGIDFHKNLCLSFAAYSGNYACLEALIREGAEVDPPGQLAAPLYLAALGGFDACLKLLLRHKANIDRQDNNGVTALMAAAEEGHRPCLVTLLDAGAQIDLRDHHGATALMPACQRGHSDIVERLLERKAGTDFQDVDGNSALILASIFNHTEIVDQLIKAHAQLDLTTNEGASALILACYQGHMQVARLLADHGADLNVQSKEGFSALMVVASAGNIEGIQFLLGKGSQVRLQSDIGKNELMFATASGCPECVELLIDSCPVNSRDKYGNTALMIAAEIGWDSIVELLLKHHADIDLQNDAGVTALLLAVKANCTECVASLLGFQASVDLVDNKGVTPLQVAVLCQQAGIARLLIQHQADPYIRNVNGDTALALAFSHEDFGMVRLLLGQANCCKSGLWFVWQCGYKSSIVYFCCVQPVAGHRLVLSVAMAGFFTLAIGTFELVSKYLHKYGQVQAEKPVTPADIIHKVTVKPARPNLGSSGSTREAVPVTQDVTPPETETPNETLNKEKEKSPVAEKLENMIKSTRVTHKKHNESELKTLERLFTAYLDGATQEQRQAARNGLSAAHKKKLRSIIASLGSGWINGKPAFKAEFKQFMEKIKTKANPNP